MAVQGWVWGINSFDQWGVELGKVLAVKVRSKISEARGAGRTVEATDGFNKSTARLLNRFLGAGAPDVSWGLGASFIPPPPPPLREGHRLGCPQLTRWSPYHARPRQAPDASGDVFPADLVNVAKAR